MSGRERAPAWLVSFGDMMTLILACFIVLVSLSKTQHVGLVASGVGSFLLAIRSFGLPGVMDEYDRASTFDHVRHRFNLPPELDPDRRSEDDFDAAPTELIRSRTAEVLRPHDQVSQPAIAVFAEDSAQLTESGQRYLDLLAGMLYPSGGQVLVLEGHARDAGRAHEYDNMLLAVLRAQAVRDYLIQVHDFPTTRVEARAWLSEIDPEGPGTRSVDARLVIPEPSSR